MGLYLMSSGGKVAMCDLLGCRVTALVLTSLVTPVCAQESVAWQDPAKHRMQFVTVEDDVRLEVLDWGASGRAVVLLAGSGNTAHVFDEFAPKMTEWCHVYAITRRGFGASSQPESGYDDQRLADDVLQVLDSLSIDAPVLVGHSMAGGELTTLGNQHSDRLAGLVYLDALGDPRDWPASDPAYMELFKKLPAAMSTIVPRSEEESKSFSGYRAWQIRSGKFALPESELRNMYETNPDGTKGKFKTPQRIMKAIGDGQKKRDYSKIRVPVLAFLDLPRHANDPLRPDGYQPKNEEERAAIEAFDTATAAYVDRWIQNLKSGVPRARVVDLQGAEHFVFLTREAEVLRGLQEFVAGLAAAAGPVDGTWEGQMHGQPGATLNIQSQGGELSGTVVFYMFRDDGGGPRVTGKTELPLVDPKLEGGVLRFKVKHHDHGGAVSFEMRLTGENEAVLKRLTENEGPNNLKMVRKK
ncbi:MAG: alpha/beta hydrolase [Acidobacteria bacterium]|nr:alpha/beta hydrolase [Acidobacteriota bacterium]